MNHPAITPSSESALLGMPQTPDVKLRYHALRKDEYQERPRGKQVSSRHVGHTGRMPSNPRSLPVCPKCGGKSSTVNAYTHFEDTDCDCDCGFVVTESMARRPTQFAPGTQEKAAIMAARYRLGIKMHDKHDRREQHPGKLVDMVLEDTDDNDDFED